VHYWPPYIWTLSHLSQVGNTLTDAEGRTHFALWCLMKAPLLIGTDLTRATAATLATLSSRLAIAVNQDPLGVQGRFIKGSSDSSSELWAGPLSGGCAAVVVVNLGDSPLTYEITWGDIGLPEGTPMRVVDVYTNTTMQGRPERRVNVTIDTAHDCSFLTVCPAGQ
jgi:alpha-galactosidase